MRLLKILLLFLVIVLIFLWAISFRAGNPDSVPLNLVFVELEASSISVWVSISFCCGVVIGVISMVPVLARQRARLFRSQRSQRVATNKESNS